VRCSFKSNLNQRKSVLFILCLWLISSWLVVIQISLIQLGKICAASLWPSATDGEILEIRCFGLHGRTYLTSMTSTLWTLNKVNAFSMKCYMSASVFINIDVVLAIPLNMVLPNLKDSCVERMDYHKKLQEECGSNMHCWHNTQEASLTLDFITQCKFVNYKSAHYWVMHVTKQIINNYLPNLTFYNSCMNFGDTLTYFSDSLR